MRTSALGCSDSEAGIERLLWHNSADFRAIANIIDSAVDVGLGETLGRGSRAFGLGKAVPFCARRQAKRRAQFLLAGVVEPIDLSENVLYSGGHIEIISCISHANQPRRVGCCRRERPANGLKFTENSERVRLGIENAV
jgi:hypothetical protein